MKKYLGFSLLCGVMLVGAVQAGTLQGETATSGEMQWNAPTQRSEKQEKKKFYVGLSVGAVKSDYIADIYEGLADELAGMGVSSTANVDKSSGAVKIFVGARTPNEHVDFRLGFTDLGEYKVNGSLAGTGGTGSFSGTYNMSGIYLSGLLKAPLKDDRGAVYAKFGIGYASNDYEESVSGVGGSGYFHASTEDSESAASYTVGLGLNYDIGKRWGLLVEAERYYVRAEGDDGKKSFSNAKFDLVTVGAYYLF